LLIAAWLLLVRQSEHLWPRQLGRHAAVAICVAVAFWWLGTVALDGSPFLRSGAAAIGAYR
jgi:hypothetical protein